MEIEFGIGEKVYFLDTRSSEVQSGIVTNINVRATNLVMRLDCEVVSMSSEIDYTVTKMVGGDIEAKSGQLFKSWEECWSYYTEKLYEMKRQNYDGKREK